MPSFLASLWSKNGYMQWAPIGILESMQKSRQGLEGPGQEVAPLAASRGSPHHPSPLAREMGRGQT